MVMLQLNVVRQIAEEEEFERAVAVASDADVTVVLIGTTEEVINERDEAVRPDPSLRITEGPEYVA